MTDRHPKVAYFEALGHKALRAGNIQEMHENFQQAEFYKRDPQEASRGSRGTRR